MLRTSLRAVTAALLVMLPLAGCSSVEPPSSGSMTMYMTDAPGTLKHAVVTISQIYLQGGSDSASMSGRVVLRDSAFTTDLLTLADSTTALLSDVVVPGGTYAQLRFVITGGYIEVDNGDGTTSIYASSPDYAGLPVGATVAGQLVMPSYSTSGLKVTLPASALQVNGGQKIILVDFNVAQSFGRQAGGSGQWVMTPVIKGGEIEATGQANVAVSLGTGVTLPVVNAHQVTLADFSATLDGDTEPLTDPDSDGVYTASFKYLFPGSYAVTFQNADSVAFTTTPTGPIPVTITSGGTASVVATITSVP